MQRAISITIIPAVHGGAAVSVGFQNKVSETKFKWVTEVINTRVPELTMDVEDDEVRLWINRAARVVARALEDDLMQNGDRTISVANARTDEH